MLRRCCAAISSTIMIVAFLAAAPVGLGAEIICGFESGDMSGLVANDKTVQVALVPDLFTEGRQACRILFPAYEEGRSQWPRVTVGRQMLAQADWRGYAAFEMDVYSDTDDRLGVEFKDTKGNSATVKQLIQTRCFTAVTVPLDEMNEKVDLSAIESVCLYITRPRRAITLTADALRLVKEGEVLGQLQHVGVVPPEQETGAAAAVVRCDAAPKVDGVLDDPCWSQCVELSPFVLAKAPETFPEQQTQAYICYDDKAIYAAYVVHEFLLNPVFQRTDELRADCTQRDEAISTDDCVELFLDPSGRGDDWLQIVVNMKGVFYDARNGNREWNSNAAIAARSYPDEEKWIVEMAVPFSDLDIAAPKEGDVWRGNFARERKTNLQNTAWNPALGALDNPASFARLVFREKPIVSKVLNLGPLADGTNEIRLHLRNPGAATRSLCVQTVVRHGGQIVTDSRQVVLAPGESSDVTVPYAVNPANLSVQIEATAENDQRTITFASEKAFPVTAGKKYFCSARVRSEAVKGGRPILFTIEWLDNAEKVIAYQHIAEAAGTFDWKRVSRTITAPPGAKAAKARLIKWRQRGTTGVGWIDDVVIVEEGRSFNLVQNPGFERRGAGWLGGATLTEEEARKGRAEVAVNVMDVADGAVVYRSPAYLASMDANKGVAQVACADGSCELFLNGERIAHGKAIQDLAISLKRGENVLGIRATGEGAQLPAVSGVFRFAGHDILTDSSWKSSTQDVAGWDTLGFDDSAWTHAKTNRPAPEGQDDRGEWITAPAIGPAGPVLLRRTVVVGRFDHLWPRVGTFFFPANSVQRTTLIIERIVQRKLPNFQFFLELPEEFSLLDLSKRPEKRIQARLHPNRLIETRIQRNGMPYRRYELQFDVPPPNIKWGSYHETAKGTYACDMFIRAGEPEAKEYSFFYYNSADSGAVIELPHELKVSVLPPLSGLPPKKIRLFTWYATPHAFLTEEEKRSVLNNVVAAGFNTMESTVFMQGYPYEPIVQEYRKRGLFLLKGVLWKCESTLPEAKSNSIFFKEHAALDVEGKPVENTVSPQYIIEADDAVLEPALFHSERFYGINDFRDFDGYIWDYELPVLGGGSAYRTDTGISFDANTIEVFRKRAGLPAEEKLTGPIIVEKFREQWIDFRNWQTAQIAAKLRRIIRKHNPAALFGVYSGYESPYTHERYGVNWNYMREVGMDIAGAGYGYPAEKIQATVEALQGKIPLIGGILYEHSAWYRQSIQDRLYPEKLKTQIFRLLAACGGGVHVYPAYALDGGAYHAVAESTRILSRFEEFFIQNIRADDAFEIAGMNANDKIVYRLGNEYLVLLLNDSEIARNISLSIRNPKDNMRAEIYPDESVPDARTVVCSVPANEVVAIHYECEER